MRPDGILTSQYTQRDVDLWEAVIESFLRITISTHFGMWFTCRIGYRNSTVFIWSRFSGTCRYESDSLDDRMNSIVSPSTYNDFWAKLDTDPQTLMLISLTLRNTERFLLCFCSFFSTAYAKRVVKLCSPVSACLQSHPDFWLCVESVTNVSPCQNFPTACARLARTFFVYPIAFARPSRSSKLNIGFVILTLGVTSWARSKAILFPKISSANTKSKEKVESVSACFSFETSNGEFF